MRELSETQTRILKQLQNTGAATLMYLAVQLRTFPESIMDDFRSLQDSGLVEKSTVTTGLPDRFAYSNEIYRISDKGRQTLRLSALV